MCYNYPKGKNLGTNGLNTIVWTAIELSALGLSLIEMAMCPYSLLLLLLLYVVI